MPGAFGADMDDLRLQTIMECGSGDFGIVAPEKIADACSELLAHKDQLPGETVFTLYERRADAYFHLKRYALATKDYDEALKLRPKDSRTRLSRAQILARESTKASTGEIEEILRDDPNFAPAYMTLAALKLGENDPEKSVDLATKAIAIDKRLPEAYAARALGYMAMDKLELALGDMNTCIELRPFSSFREPPEQAYYLRAVILVRLGRYGEAAQSCQLALRIDPESFRAAHCQWSAYLYMGKARIAYQLASELHRKWPKEVDGFLALAQSAASVGEMDDALEAAKQGTSLDAQNADAHAVVGLVHLVRGEYTEALGEYDRALELDGENKAALRGKIVLLSSCGDAKLRDGKKARDLGAKLAQVAGKDDASSSILLGLAVAECGDFERAVELVKKGLESGSLPVVTRKWAEGLLRVFQSRSPWRLRPGEAGPCLPTPPRSRATRGGGNAMASSARAPETAGLARESPRQGWVYEVARFGLPDRSQ
jgi:tetratricopeptide (TPR) repeat protein